jgi:hypothetical protein
MNILIVVLCVVLQIFTNVSVEPPTEAYNTGSIYVSVGKVELSPRKVSHCGFLRTKFSKVVERNHVTGQVN